MSEPIRPIPLIPEVPEDDWEGLVRLRYALAVMRREKVSPSPPPPAGPEMSGIHTNCWHPVDRIARLPPNLPSYQIVRKILKEHHS